MTFTATNTTIKSYFNGSRRSPNIFWAITISLGGLGFFLNGLASFFELNICFPFHSGEIAFIPQGITMLFYGTLSFLLGTFLILTIYWNVGYGYNEYNKKEQLVRIVRKGFPGKNREIFLVYPFEDIKTIELEVSEGINPKRVVYLCTKDERRIPLTPVQEPLELSLIEKQATNLAKFLDVNLSLK